MHVYVYRSTIGGSDRAKLYTPVEPEPNRIGNGGGM